MMFQENYKGILENNYQKILLNEPLSPKTSLIFLVYLLSLMDWLGPEKSLFLKNSTMICTCIKTDEIK